MVRLPTGLDQLEGHVAQMILWLEEILEYINGVLASGEFPEDQKIGRKLMEIVTQVRPIIIIEKFLMFYFAGMHSTPARKARRHN